MSLEQHYKNFPHATFRLCKFFLIRLNYALAIAMLLCSFVSAQTTLVDPSGDGGFETGTTFAANGWTVINGANNKWFVGTAATGYSGARGAFIGTNPTTYSYSGTTSHAHFYRDINIPANERNLTITFKIECGGDNVSNLTVYLAPTSYTPVVGSTPSILYRIGQVSYYGYASYTSVTINVNCVAAGNQRLIFSWNNSTTVNNPPAAVDRISVVSSGCTSLSGTGYTLITALPYSSSGRNTCGMVNDFTSDNTIICGSSSFLGGEDEIFEFTPASSGILTAAISNATSLSSAIMLYKGCPSSAGCSNGTCLAYNQNSTGSKALCWNVEQDSTYFLLVDGMSGCYTYDLSISVAATIANDLPCGATPIAIGTMVADNNSCAEGNNEPPTPGCWTPGMVNSLWYSFVAPSSGAVHVRVECGTLITPQIELFSGACGSLTSTNTCGDYSTLRCPGITWTGLSSGSTYYIRLDGYSNDIGSYSIGVDDNSGTLTPLSQDCAGAVEICGSFYSAPNNSIGCGNISDLPSPGSYSNPSTNPYCCNSGCLLAGELNPRWYRIDINSSGTLNWTLTCSAGGYFDWEMWNITNNSCSDIRNNELAPIRCNWNGTSIGSTGMESSPPNANNFELPLSVVAGETYVLCITNWSYITTASYTLNFGNSTCTIGGSAATWNGYGGNDWASSGSWSSCTGIPTCGINAVINSSASQPVVSSNASVNDLLIDSGATLTINAGVTLTVCGNFTNHGSLIASPTSTIIFTGTGDQTINGLLTGANKFGNLTITKNSGSVIANADLDVAGKFTTSNITSIFNANGKYIKLAGHFANSSGSTTFINSGTGTLEFNGSSNQNYTPGGALTLNNVTINQSSTSKVTLNGNMKLSGILTLTNGRITTGNKEVNVLNTISSSVPEGSINSYIDGNLRRSVNATGSYDFPVGEYSSGKGYQRVNINFTSASNVTDLLANFNAYSVVPAPLAVTDCGCTYDLPALDNGSWNITSTPAMSSGAYTATLYNTAGTYTNASGANNWTVMKDDGTGWFLDGTCAPGTLNAVVRNNMSGFSDFGTALSSSGPPTAAEAMITANGPTTFCAGSTVVLTVAAPGLSYQWKKNGANISGATLQSYTVKKTGDFTCAVSNSCGSTTSNIISVTVNPKPTVSVSAAPCTGGAVLLTCTSDPSTGVKYKWKKNGAGINGATNPTYSATTNGTYKCTVTIIATGCKKTTPESSVAITCRLDRVVEAFDVTVYPNPSSEAFTFTTSVFDADGEIVICDITGKFIESHLFSADDVTAGENLPDGIYLAKINVKGELVEVIKLVKTR